MQDHKSGMFPVEQWFDASADADTPCLDTVMDVATWRSVYPTDEWRLVESRFNPDYLGQAETLFAVANGCLGLRGSFEDGAPVHHPGTFVNGFFESWPMLLQ